MNKNFVDAIDQLEKEKGIPRETLFEAIESALISAYKKNYGVEGNIEVRIDREEGDIEVVSKLDVVNAEDLEDRDTQISLEEAREIDPEFEIGDQVEYQSTPTDFGRIAAQIAKQVVVQRIREAERGMIYDDYVERIGDVITGTVQRISNDTIFVNLGKTEGILSVREQVPGEHFGVNERIKVYIMDVKKTTKGLQIFLSRSHPSLVKKLFEMEVPEIEEGLVEIKGIAREAGSRTKMTVYSEDENIDPVGACVGARGLRVQSVVDEISNEKIDIIPWSPEPAELVINVLSPAKVEEVFLYEEENMAEVIVPDYQLSLAIGKAGQNVRLAAKICGWKIDIKSHSQYYGEEGEEGAEETTETLETETETTGAETEEAEAESVDTEATEDSDDVIIEDEEVVAEDADETSEIEEAQEESTEEVEA